MNGDHQLVQQSGHFDADYYEKEYPDVVTLGMDPLDHFMRIGAALGRRPNNWFSCRDYLVSNPDVEQRGLNPLVHYLRNRPVGLSPSQGANAPTEARKAGQPLIFISGEATSKPGFFYRIERWAAAFRCLGEEVIITDRNNACQHLPLFPWAKFLFIWRAEWCKEIETIVQTARVAGTPIFFDLDDLMSRPELATAEFIDAIRYDRRDPKRVQTHYANIARTMGHASYCSAATAELAWHMRRQSGQRPTFVLPNGFSEENYKASRVAARKWKAERDNLVRLGYASGSRTHQADFRLCASAVASVLKSRSDCRLVLFRKANLATLDLTEYPEFVGLEAQIEWREFVPHDRLPDEIARFDVNLAPLDFGNPYVEAKSELKWFEAAICDVPTIASPTGPLTRAIGDPSNGLLAANEGDWRRRLEELVASRALRQRIGMEAHRRALWMFGPTRRAHIAHSVLMTMQTGRAAATGFRAYAEDAERKPAKVLIAEHDITFEHDSGNSSDVTVIIPAFNYVDYITEALESVNAQSLANIDLVVVDDKSEDETHEIVLRWTKKNTGRFNRIVLALHKENCGVGHSRNTGFHLSDTLFVMALDADNKLRRQCCEKLHDRILADAASFAYGTIQCFGDGTRTVSARSFHPASFISGNGTDAMAMISKEAWSLVGGMRRTAWGGRITISGAALSRRGCMGSTSTRSSRTTEYTRARCLAPGPTRPITKQCSSPTWNANSRG